MKKPHRNKWQIPVCKFCGLETNWGHICEACKEKREKEKKLISKTELIKQISELQEEPTRQGVIDLINSAK